MYQVGDSHNSCGSLSCLNGQAGTCNRHNGPWSNKKVVCQTIPDWVKAKKHPQLARELANKCTSDQIKDKPWTCGPLWSNTTAFREYLGLSSDPDMAENPTCRLLCQPKVDLLKDLKLIGDSTGVAAVVQSNDGGKTICEVTTKFIRAKTKQQCQEDRCCINGGCETTACNQAGDANPPEPCFSDKPRVMNKCNLKTCKTVGKSWRMSGTEPSKGFFKAGGWRKLLGALNKQNSLRRSLTTVSTTSKQGTTAPTAPTMRFITSSESILGPTTWHATSIMSEGEGATGKAFSSNMLSKFQFKLITVQIDCADGWCKGPQGEAKIEFTVNIVKEQPSSKNYRSVGVCEMGWSNPERGGRRASKFHYFQLDQEFTGSRKKYIKKECCKFFRQKLGEIRAEIKGEPPAGCSSFPDFLEVGEGLSARSRRDRAHRSSSMANGGS